MSMQFLMVAGGAAAAVIVVLLLVATGGNSKPKRSHEQAAVDLKQPGRVVPRSPIKSSANGLDVERRKTIYRSALAASKRSIDEAEDAVGVTDPKFVDIQRQLEQKYLKGVAREFDVSLQVLTDIEQEGKSSNWPLT
ncbi:hypothetical protein Pan216_23030 [Planctomycetes bacterium Pan216]|uniref:Uncharacterized protein n=1 Tax=Kolteria novifilia TaxID=2527975 RepID=A0A518B3E5_9BACT|nr:hypothetical protein Pan216_23030 [Planctomycetes bacterium Pan216]